MRRVWKVGLVVSMCASAFAWPALIVVVVCVWKIVEGSGVDLLSDEQCD